MPHLPQHSERRHAVVAVFDEKNDGFIHDPFSRAFSPPGTPDTARSESSPLLSAPSSPFSIGSSSPFFNGPRLSRSARQKARSTTKILYFALFVVAVGGVAWREQERPVVKAARSKVKQVATKAKEQRCRLMPWIASCPDPFARLVFAENAGELLYPAVSAFPPASSSAGPTASLNDSPSVPPQPHPIHHLISQANAAWSAKTSRQSKTLEEAVSQYQRRYGRAPPRGFDAWYRFAVSHNVPLIDEYDSINERILPYAALRPEILQERSAMLQNTTGGEEYWLHQHSVTIKVEERGRKVTAEGPMRKGNDRADQILKLLEGFSEFLPDLNITITGQDVPWITLGAEHKQQHIEAARAGEYLDDMAAYEEDWSYDGWSLSCPPESPLREAGRYDERKEAEPTSKTTSFIGVDHVKAMDVCYHIENQAIHGYTAWDGPRPGLLFPMFSFSTTSLHSDLLLPPLEQYERPVGPDPAWKDKKQDRAVWRGSTTGSDLSLEHARKYSQRVRLARIPHSTGQITVPFSRNDRSGAPGNVESLTASALDFADEYLDIKFAGYPQQCGSEASCAKFESEFEWDGYMSVEDQNEYRYVIDVDGNGWSGRMHRLMASNTLVLKSTIFPEWYSERIQPWVHYVPLKIDYSDLFPIMAFFKGSPFDGAGSHEDLAERIAMAGKKWTETHWRWEDMQAYLFRLLLEYSRVMKGPGNDYEPVAGDLSGDLQG
ncbi:hypothetical protein JCM11641_001189 [Rhodosporidiobolus odoratus]